MYRRVPLLLTIVMFALACCAQRNDFDTQGPLNSYGFRAALTGTVHDKSGAPVSGARVEIIDPGTGRSVGTGYTMGNGSFDIPNLPRAEYDVVASSGVAEARAHLYVDTDRDISISLPITTSTPGQNAISVTQMNVPGKARRLLEKAQQAWGKSHIDEAFGFVEKALVCYPNYAKALVLRGILRMQKGDNKDAQPDLEKAVQLDYSNDLGFVALASLYNNEGEYDRAQQTLDHSMSLNPKSWQAALEMARAQLGKKDYGAAVRTLDRAAMLTPPSVNILALYRAQALIGLNDYQGAIGQLETYLSKSAQNDRNAEMARNTLTKLKEFTASAQK